MSTPVVDLRSDTVTKPAAAMRAVMAEAEVGDDVYGEDPTVSRLETHAAAMFGKEAGLFVPSGTMANLVAILAQTRPGDGVIMAAEAHPYLYESGNVAAVAGLMTRLLEAPGGILDADAVAPFIDHGEDVHHSPTTLVTIENTYNAGGGTIYPLAVVETLARLVRAEGLRLHCDGARIFNAIAAGAFAPEDFGRHVDTLSFCLSKGLGAPVGSLVVGDAAVVDRARRYRKMLGGGMRQAGIVAAAGLYALEHHVTRLADDHRRARAFHEALEDLPGVTLPLPCPTNLVYFEVGDGPRVRAALAERGILVSGAATFRPNRLRAVFHLDVDDTGLHRAIAVARSAMGG
jgi:threonine aldolase